jgi:pyruvate dehydrogenase E1 component alpha subunit
MGTSVERASAVTSMQQKAEGYGMTRKKVDGMDLMKVREAALEALEHIRAGKGPYFLEIITYRFRGHSMGDPERYRKQDEVHKWQENDPIGLYGKYLVKNSIATQKELTLQEKLAETEVSEAVEFAEMSPEPAPETLFEHIYVD